MEEFRKRRMEDPFRRERFEKAQVRERVQVDRDELLDAIFVASAIYVREVMSETGSEVLQMLHSAVENLGMTYVEAYEKTTATAGLSDDDLNLIDHHLWLATFLEEFRDYEG